MAMIGIRFDLRVPPFADTTHAEQYAACLDSASGPTSWASTSWCSPSTTASTTATCPRR